MTAEVQQSAFDSDKTRVDQWGSEHLLAVSTAVQVLRDSFLNLDVAGVVDLGEGWDYRVFRVNDKWIFRFPKRSSVVRTLHMEWELLPLIDDYIPADLPNYIFHGKPHRLYPYDFGGYQALEGMPLCQKQISIIEIGDLALQVGKCLGSLHTIPAGQISSAARLLDRAHVEIDRARTTARNSLEECRHALPNSVAETLSEHIARWAPAPGFAANYVLTHRDFRPEHLILNKENNRIAAIIDWSDAAWAPPWTDFLWIWICYGDSFVQKVLDAYGVYSLVDHLQGWIRGFGTLKAINELAYGIRSHDGSKREVALQAINREWT